MGILDTINDQTSGFSDAFGFGGSDILSGALGYFGATSANVSNKRQAAAQRAWQEHMDSTKYERTVRDLKEAGLNPMLAYTNGVGGTPSGATARMENVGESAARGLASGAAAKAAVAQADNIKSQTALNMGLLSKAIMETDVASANSENIRAATLQTLQDIARAKGDETWTKDLMSTQAGRGIYGAGRLLESLVGPALGTASGVKNAFDPAHRSSTHNSIIYKGN